MKRIIPLLFAIFCSVSILGQISYPHTDSQNNRAEIYKVELTDNETIVYLKLKSKAYRSFSISSSTIVVPLEKMPTEFQTMNLELPSTPNSRINVGLWAKGVEGITKARQMLSDDGFLIRSLGKCELDQPYKVNESNRDYYYFEMHFDRILTGFDKISIRELIKNGKEWSGISVTNPYPTVGISKYYNEALVKEHALNNNDGIVGIYEGNDGIGYKLGCVRDGDNYQLVYLGENGVLEKGDDKPWRLGEIKAKLRSSATNGVFMADWYMRYKDLNKNAYVIFDGIGMKTIVNTKEGKEEDYYIKMYPTNNNKPIKSGNWSGTGFALNNGLVVTNYHVVENAKTVKIQGIHGDFNSFYNAEVISIDEKSDIAILKVNDKKFEGFGLVPYRIEYSMADVGEDIFVLGYPLTATMGDEIKLTTGVVSSKSGFMGDKSLYQISAPIQPGNSGGPLFNSNGNVIGIVCAKHDGAEGVGYAIKSSYLIYLIESSSLSGYLPKVNNLSSKKTLSEKVKSIDFFVYKIICSDVTSKDDESNTLNKKNGVNSNQPHSLNVGRVQTHDGGIYNGELKNGVPHGKGKTVWANGNKYDGEYVDGFRQGYGIYTFSDGARYEGNWQKDHQHGFGTGYFANGDKYVGDWDHDWMQGHGTMYKSDGTYYDGDYLKDCQHGHGKLTFPDGSCYIGGFANFLFHGFGKLVAPDGSYYEGYWKNMRMDGDGVFQFSNGIRYESKWENGRMVGTIKLVCADGKIFFGQLEKGNHVKDKGVFKYEDGTIYEGELFRGEFSGEGKMSYPDGRILIGKFEKGKFVGN